MMMMLMAQKARSKKAQNASCLSTQVQTIDLQDKGMDLSPN